LNSAGTPLRVTALAGGVGAARMLAGLAAEVGQRAITAVVNTGDDTVLHGLYVSPDIDTITYTLAGAANRGAGWGLEGESWTVMGSLRAFEGVAPPDRANLTWFNLGDRDLGTHLFRTGRLAAGATLSEVTAEVACRFGLEVRLLPMTDDRVETRLTVELRPGQRNFGGLPPEPEPTGPEGGVVEIGFQEYFVGLHHSVEVKAVRFAGAGSARPAPGVLVAIEQADVLVICPSNPVVSIGPPLAVPGIAEAVIRRRDSNVAVSPIVAGKALKGPADRMLVELGHEASAVGIAKVWSALAGTLVVDEADAELAPKIEAQGMHCVVAPSVMSGPVEAANLARVVLGAATGGGRGTSR
jgi:LPPG:FO 2-phospho-L-lactate transferase